MKLYRVQISTLQGKRWVSKYAISRNAVRFMLSSSRVSVLQVVEA